MPNYLKWILIEFVIFALVITGVVALEVLVIQPHFTVSTNMPVDGHFTIRQTESGELEISWPQADRAEYYLFQLYQLPNDGQFTYQNDAGTLVYEAQVRDGNSLTLPADGFTGKMLFKVRSVVTYQANGTAYTRFSDNAVQTVTNFEPPIVDDVSCTPNPVNQTVAVKLQATLTTTCNISIIEADGQLKLLKTVHGDAFTLQFGEEGDLPMPAFGERYRLHLDIYREDKGVVYYSTDFTELTIDRSMLVPSDITLSYGYEQTGCRLNWGPEDCDFYEIQYYDGATDSWKTVERVDEDAERTYLFTDLRPDQILVVRVAACYEREDEKEDGTVELTVRLLAISNEIGVKQQAFQPDLTEETA
jgi:hypothetical protein